MQDLRIKRERLAPDVHVHDPLGWHNKTAANVCSYDMNLQVVEAFDEPRMLICASGDGNGKVIFSPLSSGDLRWISHARRSQLS